MIVEIVIVSRLLRMSLILSRLSILSHDCAKIVESVMTVEIVENVTTAKIVKVVENFMPVNIVKVVENATVKDCLRRGVLDIRN